jgi:hypothetical protein
MAAGTISLVAVLRDARKRAPQDEVEGYDSNLENAVLESNATLTFIGHAGTARGFHTISIPRMLRRGRSPGSNSECRKRERLLRWHRS